MKYLVVIVPFFAILTLKARIADTDDRFIKRYALMKMYETCFGPDAVKEIRKEMKFALAKCTGAMPAATTYSNVAATAFKAAPAPSIKTSTFQNKQSHVDSKYSPEHLKSHTSSHIDLNKLQQVILAGYNKQAIHHQPSSYSGNLNSVPVLGFSHVRPWNYAAAAAAAAATAVPANAFPYSFTNSLFSVQPSTLAFMSPALNYPINPLYPAAAAFYPQYGAGRSSRDLDVRGQLESLAVRINGRIRNITCIMQELGYLNENLEPDYAKIISRVKELSISNDLKNEMVAGVEYCKQFSQCVPEDSKEKYTKDMMRPMFFFRCYKHKKMEACIIKDIRERYSADDISENLIGIDRNDRSSREKSNNYMAELALYEFLYGADNMDVEDML